MAGWYGTWPYREALRQGDIFSSSLLSSFGKRIHIINDYDMIAITDFGIPGLFAFTLPDGTTPVGFGRITPNITAGANSNPATIGYTASSSTDRITSSGLLNNYVFSPSGGVPPAPLANGTNYYVINYDGGTGSFQVAATRGGSAIDLTTNGSGTQTLQRMGANIDFRVNVSVDNTWNTNDIILYLYFANSGQTDGESKSTVFDSNRKMYLPFENTGTQTDWTSNANDGTSVNSPTLATGQIENALQFNGSNQYVNIGNQSVNRNGTFGCWFRINSGSAYQGLISFGSGKLYLRITNSNTLEVLQSQTAILLTGSTTLSTGTWYKAEVKISSGTPATVTLLLNGASEGTTTTSGTFNVTNSDLAIGVDRYNSNTQTAEFFNGIIDDVFMDFTERSADWSSYAYQDEINNTLEYTVSGSNYTFYADNPVAMPVATIWKPPILHKFAIPRSCNY